MIPKGMVATYGQIAELAGHPGAAQAVGNAIHTNTDPARVPCHRVVDAQGRPGNGYAFGGPGAQLERLADEGVRILADHVDLDECGITIESHPLEPFLPAGAKVLFLGSFPPPRARWSMEFFYPNFINDFWRIQGLIYHSDPGHFIIPGQKRFDLERIKEFCIREGFAFYDTASRVCRLKANASDDFLVILKSADIPAMLTRMPQCRAIATTGGKASEELSHILEGLTGESVKIPPVGGNTAVDIPEEGSVRQIIWQRLPSSSRAFPMSLEKKAEAYARFYETLL